jgi:heme-degrading monooxygenase HmoA
VSDRVQHVVLFKFHEPLSEEDEQEMFRRVRAWPDTIPGFTGLRIGRDVGGNSEGYDYLLLTEFESEEAHRAYYPQPDHQAFSKWVAERGVDLIRVDYALTSESLVL